MFMLIPLNGSDTQESTVCAIDKRQAMALLELESNAEVIEINFVDDIDAALAGGVDYLIVDNPKQELDDFFDYEVDVLECMPGSTIDDVLEGFLFRTLREVV